jgi:hypothetical protein
MYKEHDMPTKKKEIIKPPTKNELKNAGAQLQKGGSAGARVAVEEKIAIQQGVAKPRTKPRSKKRG